MPQFDKVTFFNQIFWFLLAFLTFYFVILKFLLPVLAASLKTRKKVMNFIFSASLANSESSVKKSYYKNLQKFLKTYKALFSSLAQKKSSIFETSKAKILGQTLS
jgi:F0F1-type ATP synthase membrane subunit b/b'